MSLRNAFVVLLVSSLGAGAALAFADPALSKGKRNQNLTLLDKAVFDTPYDAAAKAVAQTPSGRLFVGYFGKTEFADQGVVWVVRKSEDEGASFKDVDTYQYDTGIRSKLSSLVAIDENAIFASGLVFDRNGLGYGLIRRSLDSGATWSNVTLFPSALSGYKLKTKLVNQGTNLFYAAEELTQAGKTASWVVRKSSDLGATWTTVQTGDRASFSDFVISSSGDYYLLLRNPSGANSSESLTLLRSVDAGTHWLEIYTTPVYLDWVDDSSFSIDQNGNMAIINWGRPRNSNQDVQWNLMHSFDGGRTWTTYAQDQCPIDETLSSGSHVQMVNGKIILYGWDCQNSSFLRISEDQGKSWKDIPRKVATNITAMNLTPDFDLNLVGFDSAGSAIVSKLNLNQAPLQVVDKDRYNFPGTYAKAHKTIELDHLHLITVGVGNTQAMIRISDNAGQTWTTTFLEPGGESEFDDIISADNGITYALLNKWVGQVGTTYILQSTDNGKSWQEVHSFGCPNKKIDGSFFAKERGTEVVVATSCADSYKLLKSDQTGLQWQEVSTFSPHFDGWSGIRGIHSGRDKEFFIRTSDPSIYRVTQTGNKYSWEKLLDLYDDNREMKASNLVVGEKGTLYVSAFDLWDPTFSIYKSLDWGQTWSVVIKNSSLSDGVTRILMCLDKSGGIYFGLYDSASVKPSGDRWRLFAVDEAKSQFNLLLEFNSFGSSVYSISRFFDVRLDQQGRFLLSGTLSSIEGLSWYVYRYDPSRYTSDIVRTGKE